MRMTARSMSPSGKQEKHLVEQALERTPRTVICVFFRGLHITTTHVFNSFQSSLPEISAFQTPPTQFREVHGESYQSAISPDSNASQKRGRLLCNTEPVRAMASRPPKGPYQKTRQARTEISRLLNIFWFQICMNLKRLQQRIRNVQNPRN